MNYIMMIVQFVNFTELPRFV